MADHVNAITARTLGPVHRPVRRFDQMIDVHGNFACDHPEQRCARHADAGGDPRRGLGDLTAYPLGESDGVSAVARHGDHELFATDSRDDRVPAPNVAEDVAHRDQRLIARRVPCGVVDPLEVVQVDHHAREVDRTVPARLGRQQADRSLEGPPVR